MYIKHILNKVGSLNWLNYRIYEGVYCLWLRSKHRSLSLSIRKQLYCLMQCSLYVNDQNHMFSKRVIGVEIAAHLDTFGFMKLDFSKIGFIVLE